MDMDARREPMRPGWHKWVCSSAWLLLLALAAVTLFGELCVARRINPVGPTRLAISECEMIEHGVAVGVESGRLSSQLRLAYASALSGSPAVRDRYIKMGHDPSAVVLDGWGQPLHMMARTNLVKISHASEALLLKTNRVVIWSAGPNGINEFGNGDDIFLRGVRP